MYITLSFDGSHFEKVAAILTTITKYHADLPILFLRVSRDLFRVGKISRVALCAKHSSRPGK